MFSQHVFDGYIDNDRWKNAVYLSVIEDYRTLGGIDDEQIISKVMADSLGYFRFEGNQLDSNQFFYKLHVDNCDTFDQSSNHFDGHCADSESILFIAKSTDSISFPLSFESQMFCDIQSTNSKTASIIQIDSLKAEMKYAYAQFRSKANRNLNNKKWFKTLQEFGEQLNEPLAELYIYSFLSDRSNSFHDYYLEDLKSNKYYEALLGRLETAYPDSKYLSQYRAELTSDRYIISENKSESEINWILIISSALVLSLGLNFWLLSKAKKEKINQDRQVRDQLTKQEQNVLELLLENNSNKDIAEALFVSVSTVKTHVNNVYKKLNINSREELKSLFNK
ncbi:MAG: helix-turn-helix transcriptional regulator [Psychroserpens sp.]|nr:helix-turn-helix transcriptional regulator [Psychroserpens sp.]